MSDPSMDPPLLLAFVADLMFASRIEVAAAHLKYQVHWIESIDRLTTVTEPGPERQPAEQLFGPGADLVELVTALRPALIIFDLGNAHIPWREWIALLKSAPATRRYPVLAYGAHVDPQALKDAKHRGANAALPRSKFAEDLPNLITEYARIPDLAAIQSACASELSETALRGIELFNHGEYFEAHERLEEAWNADQTPGRELYRAILQVAVAYLQIERGNYNGAIKMFLRLRQWIEPLPDVCRGVDVERLRSDAHQVRLALLAAGRENISDFDRSLFRPVCFRE